VDKSNLSSLSRVKRLENKKRWDGSRWPLIPRLTKKLCLTGGLLIDFKILNLKISNQFLIKKMKYDLEKRTAKKY